MGLTSWYSFSTNEVLTSAKMNEQLRDNGRWLSHNATGGAPMCRVYQSATLSGHATGAAITFDSERFDLGSMHSTVSNTSRITIPASSGGKYLVGVNARFTSLYDASGSAELMLGLRVNGTTYIAAENQIQEAGATRTIRLGCTTLWQFAAADYVEALVDYTNMTTVDVIAASSYGPEMWALWVGE